MNRPNIVLLYTDQQRWDTIEAAGYPHMHTPHLNKILEKGVAFDRAYCNAPVCMPSRQSMLSGQYPSTIGSTCNGIEMAPNIPTLPHYLKPYGYTTANIGKLHFLNHAHRDHKETHPNYGFDYCIISDEPGCYDDAYIKWVEGQAPEQVENCRTNTPPAHTKKVINNKPGRNTHEPYFFEGPDHLTHTAFVGEETCRFIRENHQKPFAVIAGFYGPHPPINPPKSFVDLYDKKDIPLPQMNGGENQYGLSNEEWVVVRKYYYAMISQVDEYVGKIIKTLEELNQLDNTLIIFTSDHGENLGDHGLVQKGPPGYDSCARVPLLFSYPNQLKPQKVRNELVEAIDILPTILDYCGIQKPPVCQGSSLKPLFENKIKKIRNSAYFEYRKPFNYSWKGVRTENFKYSTSNKEEEFFFDLKNDPYELKNIAHDPKYASEKALAKDELLKRWFQTESQYPLQTGEY